MIRAHGTRSGHAGRPARRRPTGPIPTTRAGPPAAPAGRSPLTTRAGPPAALTGRSATAAPAGPPTTLLTAATQGLQRRVCPRRAGGTRGSRPGTPGTPDPEYPPGTRPSAGPH